MPVRLDMIRFQISFGAQLSKMWREFMLSSGAGVVQEGKQEDIEKYSKRTVKVHPLYSHNPETWCENSLKSFIILVPVLGPPGR